jgi:hypothetical protein
MWATSYGQFTEHYVSHLRVAEVISHWQSFFTDNPLFGLKRVVSSFMANAVSLSYSDRVTFHFSCFMFRLERTHGQRRPQTRGRHLMNRHAAVVSGGGMLL